MTSRRQGRVWAVAGATLAAAVLGSALSIIEVSHRCRDDYARLQSLETARWRMQEQWGRLLLEQSTWAAHHRVEKLARKELGMRLPSTDELEVVLP